MHMNERIENLMKVREAIVRALGTDPRDGSAQELVIAQYVIAYKLDELIEAEGFPERL